MHFDSIGAFYLIIIQKIVYNNILLCKLKKKRKSICKQSWLYPSLISIGKKHDNTQERKVYRNMII